jgi:hypothetical protein
MSHDQDIGRLKERSETQREIIQRMDAKLNVVCDYIIKEKERRRAHMAWATGVAGFVAGGVSFLIQWIKS